MSSFEPQYWNGYELRLRPNGARRIWLSEIYFFSDFPLFDAGMINFDLQIAIPKNKKTLEPIRYEWEQYNRTNKEVIKTGTGYIEFSRIKSKIHATCNNAMIGRVLTPYSLHPLRYDTYFRQTKAIDLGYQEDAMKGSIRVKFINGEIVSEQKTMALFHIHDRGMLIYHIFTGFIDLLIGAVFGAIAGYFFASIMRGS